MTSWWAHEGSFTEALREVRQGFDEILLDNESEEAAHEAEVVVAGGCTKKDSDKDHGANIQRLDAGLQRLVEAESNLYKTSTDESTEKENLVATKIVKAAQLLARHHTQGVCLCRAEVTYELSLYYSVWTTHPFAETPKKTP
eukprot:TRINITY_DN31975_c0_g1_i1.p1 TRINITY_DN31975_c0_g1~~TRINITY_DN31975_c0_g1_i1.p1  ORF type:complete len:142 (+),score=32.14 TRINITY_DN31975_c0_g1_i1:36-461(+)